MAESNRVHKQDHVTLPRMATGTEAKVIRAGQAVPPPNRAPVPNVAAYEDIIRDPQDQLSVADGLNFLKAAFGPGTWTETTLLPTGERRITLETPAGTQLGGKGLGAREAYNDLLDQIDKFGLISQEMYDNALSLVAEDQTTRGDDESVEEARRRQVKEILETRPKNVDIGPLLGYLPEKEANDAKKRWSAGGPK